MEQYELVAEPIESIDSKRWNHFLIQNSGSFFNSYESGYIRQKIFKEKIEFISYYYKGDKVGQLLIRYSYPDPRIIQSYICGVPFLSTFIGRSLIKLYKRVVWCDGPVFCNHSQFDKQYLIKKTANYLKGKGIKDVTGYFCPEDNDEIQLGLGKWATYVIHIDNIDNLEMQLKKLPSATRYQIRRAARDGVEVTLIENASQIEQFLERWSLAREDKGGYKIGKRLMQQYYKRSKEMESCDFNLLWLGAYYEDELIGGVGLVAFGEKAGIESFFTCDIAREKHLFVGDALIWRAIQECAKRKIKYLDLLGVNPQVSSTDKEKGIAFFKSRWSGEYREYWNINKESIDILTR